MYSCTVRLRAHVLLKWECDLPQMPSSNRSWQIGEAEVCGTKLELRTFRTTVDASLQHADAGVAADYHRRSFVLRVRADGRQFLLAVSSCAAMLQWIEKLNEAAAISLPLETRKEPGFYLTPPKRPRTCGATLGNELRRNWREKWCASRIDRQWLQAESVHIRDDAATPHEQSSLDTAYKYAHVLQYESKWRTGWCGPSGSQNEASGKLHSASADLSLWSSHYSSQGHILDIRTLQALFISP